MTPLTFIHLSDTHVGPTRDFTRYGVASYPTVERIVDMINAMPILPDFVAHTGDVSSQGDEASYRLAAEVFGRLKMPIYYVTGNHDDPALIRSILGAPPHPYRDDPDARLDYSFEIKGERFIVMDVRSAVDPEGHVTEEQLERLHAECTPEGPPLTMLIHYPPFPMNSPWLDKHMLIDNGADLHAALLPARERLRGVFSGHMHRNTQIVKDGIVYNAVASTFSQFAWRPWSDTPEVDYDYLPAYNHVHYMPGYVVVQQYTFPRP